ncbi:MAG: glycerate kinase [Herbinix sp.]|jgi:glycerate kinase|nr:glycerate kinase [Herbinix sp.]
MKKCIIISDSFKGTLSSSEIARIAKTTVPEIFPDCEVLTFPVADGGEGTVECFLETLQGESVSLTVVGPYPEETIEAIYGRFGNTAVIEMASVSGLPLVGTRKNPAATTTYGVGQLIAHALEQGCTEILLGLGGSATNDGGCGCAAALGTIFYNQKNDSFIPTGGTLDQITRICNDAMSERLKNVRITIMCDVDNPMYGPKGAAYVFAPQKGADAVMVQQLDDNLRHLSDLLQSQLQINVAEIPGAGAAGAMGAGCLAFLGAELKSGIEAILDMLNFDSHLEGADLVITGEGKIDNQSINGKVISGIANRTKPHDIPLVAIVGCIDDSASAAYELGITAMFSIDRAALPFSESSSRSAKDYRLTLIDVLRLIRGFDNK